MLRCFVIFCASIAVFVNGTVEPGPSYPASKGEVWPKPQQQTKYALYFTFNPSDFHVKIKHHNCSILAKAIQRYSYVFENFNKLVVKPDLKNSSLDTATNETKDNNHQGLMKNLEIDLTAPCEDYPYFGMDERYNVIVAKTSQITSASLWGILRGLETFAHLIYLSDDFKEMRLNKTEITDFPRYPHRGMLLDTSRHYISMDIILKMLDAMSMNKFNVFHWHIVDDQSFPYQSEKFPELSARGAYHPSMIYTRTDVETVIEYARERGIRVIPEIDVPGHTRSWGEAFPNILTKCYNHQNQSDGLGPMNPIHNSTYKVVRQLFNELQQLFKDKFFHVGGDEVELSCWNSNPELKKYMSENNMTVQGLHALFMRNVIPMLNNGSTPIVWEEVFSENVVLSKETLVQIWKTTTTAFLVQALRAGYRVLYSASWYLDYIGSDFWTYYNAADPRQRVIQETKNATLAAGVVGGEACMWGEMVDDRNVLSRVWPRASAAAEKLWSASSTGSWYYRYNVPVEIRRRAEEHTCRMARRGIPSQPVNGPGFCIA